MKVSMRTFQELEIKMMKYLNMMIKQEKTISELFSKVKVIASNS